MVRRSRPHARTMALGIVMAVGTAILTLSGSSSADVTAVRGSAFGVFGSVSLFGGPPGVRGPMPTVTLPPGGSTVPVTASAPTLLVAFGPATLFTSGPATVSTQGTTGPGGQVTSSADIMNVNTSGQEVFTASRVQSSCTASEAGVSGTTTISGGTLQTSEGDPDVDGDETIVNIPMNPTPNTTFTGTIETVGDNFRFVVNEQIVNPDGSITVNAAHLYLLGPTAVGDVIIGQSDCGVTAVTVPTTTTTTTLAPTTTTTTLAPTTTTTLPAATTTTLAPPTTTTLPPPTTTTLPAAATTTVPAATTTTTGSAPTAQADPSVVEAGQQTTLSGSGFPPNTPLEVILFSDPVLLDTTTTDAAGSYLVVVTIPIGTTPGTHQIVVRGGGSQATTTVTVVTSTSTSTTPPGGGVTTTPCPAPCPTTVPSCSVAVACPTTTLRVGALVRTGSDSDLQLAWAAMALTLGGLFVMGAKGLPSSPAPSTASSRSHAFRANGRRRNHREVVRDVFRGTRRLE